tara:strand:+ start:704 stop:1162 length:459 start_codon:yes stop_codon:yes gene_type:complete
MKKCWLGNAVLYDDLSGKEKESYNAAKLAALMSDYGYLESFKINGDKWGADLLFYRASDSDVKKVQLKGRATFDKNYVGKDLYIAFPMPGDVWCIYPHDVVMRQASGKKWKNTMSWTGVGGYSWNIPPVWLVNILRPWMIQNKENTNEDSSS